MLKLICDILRQRSEGRKAAVWPYGCSGTGLIRRFRAEHPRAPTLRRGRDRRHANARVRVKGLPFCKAEADLNWAHGLLFRQLSGKVLFYFVLYLVLKKAVILTSHNYIIKARKDIKDALAMSVLSHYPERISTGFILLKKKYCFTLRNAEMGDFICLK